MDDVGDGGGDDLQSEEEDISVIERQEKKSKQKKKQKKKDATTGDEKRHWTFLFFPLVDLNMSELSAKSRNKVSSMMEEDKPKLMNRCKLESSNVQHHPGFLEPKVNHLRDHLQAFHREAYEFMENQVKEGTDLQKGYETYMQLHASASVSSARRQLKMKTFLNKSGLTGRDEKILAWVLFCIENNVSFYASSSKTLVTCRVCGM